MSSIPESLALIRGTSLETGWARSQRALPEALPFLEPDFIAGNGAWASLPPEAIADVQQAAGQIGSDPDLTRLAWHCHHVLFVGKQSPRTHAGGWPLLAELLGDYGGAFYLLIYLSGLPQIRERHQAPGIPENVMRDTYRDAYVWAKQYHDIGVCRKGRFFHPGTPGKWGLDTRMFPWLLNHLYGDLYRVGRLQYKVGPFGAPLRAYRNPRTGAVRLLADSGVRFRGDGYIDGAGGVEDPENGWTAELRETAEGIAGTPIHPSGRAVREEVSLRLEDWELVLSRGDRILEIHIPEDGPMDFDACGESLRGAADFFPRYFPDRPFRAICCVSWFLDPVYQKFLSERSNIVRFQRECYLFPVASRDGRSGVERIFGPYTHDLATAPRDTSMRRAVLDHLDRGGILVAGGALFFPEDLGDWGTQRHLNSML